ncbi:MAG: asparagine synthase C-terminal domain-containing protein, partial [Bacteroidetes bacterium]|nr:asparagine synthase C-terminal domain-containing protein [Bacteroidota bacterium]
KTKIEKYWDYSAPDYAKTFIGRQQQFKDLLIDSLRLRQRSDVPLGAMLSGGLDSSAIVTLIQEHINKDIQSFSVVSNEKNYSEESFVDILINEKGINNKKLRFNSELALENIHTVLNHQDEPFASMSVVAQYLLFKKIKNETNIKVLFSGQGADEVLMGYKKFYFMHLQELLRKRKIFTLMNSVGASFLKGTTIKEFSWNEAKRYLPGKVGKGRDYFNKEFNDIPIWSSRNLSLRQIEDIDKYSVPILAHFEDRNSMANSLEVRLPFLDFRLVNFLVHAPIEDKLKGGWTKYILRESINEMPKAIRWRKDKTGFITPEEKWLKGKLGTKITNDFQARSLLSEMGILDPEKFTKSLKRYQNSSGWLNSKDYISIYITELWLRKNF